MGPRVSRLLLCLLSTVPLGAVAPQRGAPQPPGDGQLYVYFQPLPPDADRLAFTVASVQATTARGGEAPLDLSLKAIDRAASRDQRLLASGRVPADGYAALSITVSRASVRRDGREEPLVVPDAPIKVDAVFDVPRGRAVVLWLEVRPGSTPASGDGFGASFAAHVAPRPLQSLAGFVSNSQSNTVTVFDKRLRQAAAVVPTGERPAGLALDRQRGRLYVACEGDDEIQTIDVASAELVDRTRLLPGDDPRELALTPDGSLLVSVNAGSNSISLFETAPLTRADRIAVGSGPGAVLIEPTGRRAFVFNTLSGSVSVVDLSQRSVVATLALDAAPLRGEFSPRGDRLLVIHERSPYVSVLDPVRLSVVDRPRLRIGIDAIKADARRNVIYVGGRDDSLLEFYDPNTLLPVNSLPTAGGIGYLAIDAEDDSLYMVSPDLGRLLVGSPAQRKVVAAIDVGAGPYWVAVMGER